MNGIQLYRIDFTFNLLLFAAAMHHVLPTPRTVAPFTPMAHSDYNNDGVLDYITDFTAFLNGYTAQEDRADINVDGVFNQADIDLWIWDFEYDEEHLP